MRRRRGPAGLGVVATAALLLMGQPATAAGLAGRFLTRFSDVTGSAGVHVAGLGNASSWVDYDGAYGQDSLALEFGVGAAPGPFRVRILWPNGAVQILTAQVNRVTSVIEPKLQEEEAP